MKRVGIKKVATQKVEAKRMGEKRQENFRSMSKTITAVFLLSTLLFLLSLIGCRKPELLKDSSNLVPVAGTVSHHTLADHYIDSFFRELASRRDISTFIILSPQHYLQQTDKTLSLVDKTFSVDGYEVSVNSLLYNQLIEELEIQPDPWAFYGEHGIEALVPYIARYFPDADILPILQREEMLNPDKLTPLSDQLRTILKDDSEIFMLLSVDFSHHCGMDLTQSRDMRSLYFLENIISAPITIVGCDNIGGMYVLQSIFKINNPSVVSEILDHTNSFDISGLDPEDITSYFFTLFSPFTRETAPVFAQKIVLRELENPTCESEKIYPLGSSHQGVAVRFHNGVKERGCMAFITGVDNLAEATEIAAIDAALFDPRYKPVSEEELPTLDIDVTLLSNPKLLKNPLRFRPKKHSLAIRLGEKHSFIQAPVSVERGWSKKEFLEALCIKAGLDKDAWKNPEARITRFDSENFTLKGEELNDPNFY